MREARLRGFSLVEGEGFGEGLKVKRRRKATMRRMKRMLRVFFSFIFSLV